MKKRKQIFPGISSYLLHVILSVQNLIMWMSQGPQTYNGPKGTHILLLPAPHQAVPISKLFRDSYHYEWLREPSFIPPSLVHDLHLSVVSKEYFKSLHFFPPSMIPKCQKFPSFSSYKFYTTNTICQVQ